MTADQPSPLRVLMAPQNFADQPMALVRALRKKGFDAHQIHYTAHGVHPLGYALDRAIEIEDLDIRKQLEVLEQCLEEGFDIYHFWQRSLLHDRPLRGLTGLDLPLIKARDASIFHRFTGADLRMSEKDRSFNKFSPYHYGYTNPFDEKRQAAYLDFLKDYVETFFVQDPEMAQFFPDARILPRGLELDNWQPIGIQASERPLIVHAPSNPLVKGSRFIMEAVEQLQRENLSFEFKQLDRVPHEQAREWYEKADIIVDQILIGATGVLTLEAWALAKPCVTFLREDLFQSFYQTSDLPVANATPDTITTVLRNLIKDFEWREDLARRGRETVEKFHNINDIADQYASICEQARIGRTLSKQDTADVRFLRQGIASGIDDKPARLSFELGMARQHPKLAALGGRYFSLQQQFFAVLLRMQVRLIRTVIVAAIWLAGRVRAVLGKDRTQAEAAGTGRKNDNQ